MRLSDTLVLQQVDDKNLVLVDDSSGQEAVFELNREAIGVMLREGTDLLVVGGIEVPPKDRAMFSFALGYFWMGMSHAPAPVGNAHE